MDPYYDDGVHRIYLGDCLEVMAGLEDRFDLVFTSPPYNVGTTSRGHFGHYPKSTTLGSRGGNGKWTACELADGYDNYDDAMPMGEYETWQRGVVAACWEHLTERGAVFYNHKPRPQGEMLWHPRSCIPAGLPVRQEIIWARAGGINFSPTYYLPTYEVIIVVAKPDWRLKSQGASGVGDVWTVPQETGSKHPAPFPLTLPARAIETTAPASVLDPFCGSGTTLRAAADAGVPSVGIDKSERYCEMAAKRLEVRSLFDPRNEPTVTAEPLF